jgi:putative ABC transport system permease protein
VLAFGAVLCVLLIACTNASGLLLVRATVRQREWAVRASLGATPARLFRQILIETGLLASAASVLGAAFASAAVRVINELGPLRPSTIGAWTFVFALAVAAGSMMLAGTLSAAALLRLPLDRSLKTGDRHATGPRGWRNLLVAGQIAIATALLFSATLLSRSFVKLLDVPLGFATERIWTAAIQLPDRAAPGPAEAGHYGGGIDGHGFFQALTSRLAALPGIESASAGQVPFNPSGPLIVDLHLPGRPVPAVKPAAVLNVVLPNYFSTLRIPLLEGRAFSELEGAGARAVAIVDRTFAWKYFPGEDAVGKAIAREATRDKSYIIVGVVGSVASRELAEPPLPHVYLSALQFPQSATYLVVRQAGEQDVTAIVREQLRAMNPNVALFDVETMAERVSHSVRLRRFVAWLLNGFALAGLLLAALGLYGTLAHAVELRRREIAIRLAVGALPGSVRRLFALHGLRVACAGLAPGLVLALLAGRAARSLLFGIGPFDAFAVAGTMLGFVALALAASWIPAARAARANAIAALRDE